MHVLVNTFEIFELEQYKTEKIEIDMGCGSGSFTVQLAQRYPDRLILASDVYSGRLNKLRRKADANNCQNIVCLRASNFALVSYQLPPQSIDRIHLLCPDPWPKKHHKSRRLVSSEFVNKLNRILKPGGVIHLSTDYEPYFEIWQNLFKLFPEFVDANDEIEDVKDIKSDFEMQWNEQGKIVQHMAKKLL